MTLKYPADFLPLHTDPDGTIRVGNTRVTLDTVVSTFKNGSTCEEIVFQFPALDLADVYAVIGFYLKNQKEIEAYLNHGVQEANRLQDQVRSRFPSEEIRMRLQKRLKNQKPAAS